MRRERLILGLVLLLALGSLAHAAWIPFRTDRLHQETTIMVSNSNAAGLTMEINVFGAEVSEYDAAKMTDIGREVFAQLKIDEYAYLGELGKPRLPMVTAVVDVPYHAGIAVQVMGTDFQEFSLAEMGIDQRLAPALASVPKIQGSRANFIIDEKTYGQNDYYPNRLTGIFEDGGLARGHRLATVQFYPIQYNPVTGRIRVYTRIRARVDFNGGDVAGTIREITKDYSSVWEDYISNMVVNYPEYLRGVPPLPIYYDIFYNGQALTLANKLGSWKTKKGYKVRMWNAAGWTAAQINDTIRLQSPRATFLTIIGDPNSSTIALPASATGGSSGDQTDLYYAETNESGYLPDMFNGRVCVMDTIQGNISVNKALRYEHANFGSAGTAWLKRACLIAGYDASYQPVGIATNAYCRSLLLPYGYQVDTLVIASSEQEQRIVQRINAGTAWCVYTAHGSQTYWAISSSGDFTIPELNTTTNNDMYSMPAGHCCLAGDYQYGSDCFGETWDRIAGKGGLAYYGSVPSTYWDEDDWLQRRYFDAVYTDSVAGRM
jgi:gingipain R